VKKSALEWDKSGVKKFLIKKVIRESDKSRLWDLEGPQFAKLFTSEPL
jgi:hypothetical protein